jgi:protein TonB
VPVVTGITLNSTVQGGAGPVMQIGNTMMGMPTKKATSPVTEKSSAPTANQAQPGQKEPQFTPAKIATKIRPKYTAEAIQDEIEGKVILMVNIDSKGYVTDVKLLKGLGYGLDELAIEAVKLWRFYPATLDGEKVSDSTRITVDFMLEQ